MKHLATLAGSGWLRTRSSGSSTATYHLDIWRRITGPNAGELVSEGKLTAELLTIAEARANGRAVLVLTDGDPIAVEIGTSSGEEAEFKVIGRAPRH